MVGFMAYLFLGGWSFWRFAGAVAWSAAHSVFNAGTLASGAEIGLGLCGFCHITSIIRFIADRRRFISRAFSQELTI